MSFTFSFKRILLLFFLIIPQALFAEEAKLFNDSALSAANSRTVVAQNDVAKDFVKPPAAFYQLDTVDTILYSSPNADRAAGFRLFSYFRSIGDFADSSYFQDIDQSSAAEKLFFYQAGNAFMNWIKQSQLKDLFEVVEESLENMKEKTTIHMTEDSEGFYRITDGTEVSERESPVLKLKLHFSARNGLEPRVNLGENCLLRFNLFEQSTRVEYSLNF